jgi:hypothetical protein
MTYENKRKKGRGGRLFPKDIYESEPLDRFFKYKKTTIRLYDTMDCL